MSGDVLCDVEYVYVIDVKSGEALRPVEAVFVEFIPWAGELVCEGGAWN